MFLHVLGIFLYVICLICKNVNFIGCFLYFFIGVLYLRK
nr:MAG TPA: hypothetical protein [Caudoviricetes sp.]